MKVIEFHVRIIKNQENHIIPHENFENHENLKIPNRNHENQKNHGFFMREWRKQWKSYNFTRES